MTDIDDIIKELGISPSGVYSDVRARLDILEARINNPLIPVPTGDGYSFIVGNNAVKIRTGAGAPTQSDPDGSLYLRTDGYAALGLYTRRSGSWKFVTIDGYIDDADINPIPIVANGGLATYLRTIKSYTPLGTSADAANIQAAGDAIKGIGELRIKSGSALLTSVPGTPAIDIAGWSKTLIIGHPGLRLVQTLTPNGGSLFANFGMQGFPSGSANTTLSSDVVLGSNTISIAASITVGNWIALNAALSVDRTYIQTQFQVKAISGSGPYTITLDRPIKFPFLSGDRVYTISKQITDFTIEGCGMEWSGTGDSTIRTTLSRRLYLKNIRFTPNDDGYSCVDVASIDIGSFESGWEDIYCYAPGASNGIMIESADRGSMTRVNVDAAGQCVVAWDCVDLAIRDCNSGKPGSVGLMISSNPATAIGNRDIIVTGGSFSGGSNVGVYVKNGNGISFRDVRADNNIVGFEMSLSNQVTYDKCKTKGNTNFNMRVPVGCTEIKIRDCENQGSPGSSVALQIDGSDVNIDGFSTSGVSGGQPSLRIDGGSTNARGLNLRSTGSANVVFVTGGIANLDGYVKCGTNVGIGVHGGVANISKMRTVDGVGTIGVYIDGGEARFGDGNDFFSSTTGIRNDNGPAAVSHPQEIFFSDTGAISTSTRYLNRGTGAADATEGNTKVLIRRKTIFRNIHVEVSAAPGTAHSTIYTVRKNGVDTGITVTLGATDTSKDKDTTANATCITFNAGDYMTVSQVPDGGGNVTANPRISVQGV